MILAQFGHGYYIRGTLKRLMGVFAWLKAWWICTRTPCHCRLAGEEMPTKVMILAQFDHGYYIHETLKRLTNVVVWLKAWWIRFDHGYYIHGTLKRVTDVVAWLKACGEEMPTKVMILAQFEHGYYIRGTLKWLMGVLVWPKASWIYIRNPCHSCLAGEEMPTKVMILAQFGHGYHIRGTLKRLMGVLAWLMAWWIRTRNPCPHCIAGEEMPTKVMIFAQFDHGYYIRETLKRLTNVVAWLKAWWICLSVKQVTDRKSMPPLPRQRGDAHKSHDFGSVWPQILYPWDFGVADGCFGLAQGLVDLLYPWDFEEDDRYCGLAQGLVTEQKSIPLLPCRGGKVVILAQFGHGYYIRGTLKRLMGVLAWLKAQWISFGHGYYIHGTLKRLMGVLACLSAWWIHISIKQVTDQKSMPLLPRRRGNARKISNKSQTRNPCHCCLAGEEMPAKVVILAQFGHGYYIRGTLKRLMGILAWPKAWWICAWWICLSVKQVTDQKSMPPLPRQGGKVVILAQFDQGYYIRGTLKWLTRVLAWLKASWIKSLEYLVLMFGIPHHLSLKVSSTTVALLHPNSTNSKAVFCAFSSENI
ncbi:hypothetical protein C8R44DRAFT_746258 [Mycena epipterygia]|nr:hypothetical protein C8R44DRAFT_746258 [Mycena epipterygia]